MSPDDLAKILDELGQRLGPAGQRVFELAVRQVVIDGVVALIAAVIATVALFQMLKMTRAYVASEKAKEEVAEKNGRYHSSMYEISYVFVAIGGVTLVSIIVLGGWTAVSNILNPEYAAIRDVLTAIRTGY